MVLARRLILALTIVTALGGSVAYLVTQAYLAGTVSNVRHVGWLVFALVTFLSLILVAVIWRSLTDSFATIRRQLQHFEAENEIGMIMIDANDELAELVAALNHYLTTVKNGLQKDRILHKELQIQVQVAEAERRQTEAAIVSISEAVLVTNKYDEVLLANPAAQKLFRFSLPPAQRLAVDRVLDDAELLQLIRKTRQNKSTRIIRVLERLAPDENRTLTLKVLFSAVLDSHHQLIGVVVVIHDVTHEKDIAQMKDDFVNSVSHELKTPLASIRAYAELLADNEAEDEAARHKFCEIIQEQAQRLDRLIDDILNISRIESGVLNINREPIDLLDVIRNVITAMSPQARERNIPIQFQTDLEALILIADRDMIHRAVMNLVSNALKYSPTGSAISLRAARNELSQAVVEVRDEGAGMPPQCLDHIFDKFYRVPENNNLAGGTGLGLHLVRQIVENVHNGHVTVSSQPGQGSTFTIYLPLTATPGPVSRQNQTQPCMNT